MENDGEPGEQGVEMTYGIIVNVLASPSLILSALTSRRDRRRRGG
jgi:hypothetical protein